MSTKTKWNVECGYLSQNSLDYIGRFLECYLLEAFLKGCTLLGEFLALNALNSLVSVGPWRLVGLPGRTLSLGLSPSGLCAWIVSFLRCFVTPS